MMLLLYIIYIIIIKVFINARLARLSYTYLDGWRRVFVRHIYAGYYILCNMVVKKHDVRNIANHAVGCAAFNDAVLDCWNAVSY